jgi:uncharacterized membrane protein
MGKIILNIFLTIALRTGIVLLLRFLASIPKMPQSIVDILNEVIEALEDNKQERKKTLKEARQKIRER